MFDKMFACYALKFILPHKIVLIVYCFMMSVCNTQSPLCDWHCCCYRNEFFLRCKDWKSAKYTLDFQCVCLFKNKHLRNHVDVLQSYYEFWCGLNQGNQIELTLPFVSHTSAVEDFMRADVVEFCYQRRKNPSQKSKGVNMARRHTVLLCMRIPLDMRRCSIIYAIRSVLYISFA